MVSNQFYLALSMGCEDNINVRWYTPLWFLYNGYIYIYIYIYIYMYTGCSAPVHYLIANLKLRYILQWNCNQKRIIINKMHVNVSSAKWRSLCSGLSLFKSVGGEKMSFSFPTKMFTGLEYYTINRIYFEWVFRSCKHVYVQCDLTSIVVFV